MTTRARTRTGITVAPASRRRWSAALAAATIAVTGLVCVPTASASIPSFGIYTSIAYNHAGSGYWTQVDGKGVTAAGGAPSYGGNPSDPATIVSNPAGDGYWLVQRNGTVQAYGKAPQLNSLFEKLQHHDSRNVGAM